MNKIQINVYTIHMTTFPLAYQNLASDLIRKCHDDNDQWRGSLYKQVKRGVSNLYVKMPVGAVRKSLFVGPEADPETFERAEAIRHASKRARQRRKDLSVLKSMGLLLTPTVSGQVVDAMAFHGLFRNGGVLVGTLAYQCYPLTLGASLPSTMLSTDDTDLAAAHIAPKADGGVDMGTILKAADSSFAPPTGFKARKLACSFSHRQWICSLSDHTNPSPGRATACAYGRSRGSSHEPAKSRLAN